MKITYKNESKIFVINNESQDIKLSLFKKNVSGKIISNEAIDWLTNVLKTESTLVKINFKKIRKTNTAEISFNDIYPIHLIAKESAEALNKKLEQPVELNRFRPNIIISGCNAFEEETWEYVTIGACEFKVVSKIERCSLITINPLDGSKDKKQEPLGTLAKEFKTNGKINFGIYLVPLKSGIIRDSDTLKIKILNSINK